VESKTGTLYTGDVKAYVSNLPFPKHFIMDAIEVWDQEPFPHVQFLVYRDNILTFGQDDLIQITNTINQMMTKLRGEGLPCFVKTLKNRAESYEKS
jgi:hypothetical protein